MRLRHLLVAILAIAIVLAVTRGPVGRSAFLACACLVAAMILCRAGLRSSQSAWESAENSRAEDGFGAFLKLASQFVLYSLVVIALTLGAVLFLGRALIRAIPRH